MSFNSIHFLLFFLTVLALYWVLRRNRVLRVAFLLVASYYFYMSWNAAYAGLILGSTLLDFFVGRAIFKAERHRTKRALLITSIAGNLGVLFVFKYYNFFIGSMTQVLDVAPGSATYLYHSLLLPVGISFYTFQTLSYTIDIYRGKLEPTGSFLNFALFVSFFPQLVAGPIVRASHFLPQLERDSRYDDRQAERGLAQVMLGLFKKICIADLLALSLVDKAFADPSACSSAYLLLAAYGYAFQIYYDFSGYSDIAIGAARMLGFDLPINFNRPYCATSMRDFWRRWHISLSTWLRDYLYVPLGGGKGSVHKTARNLAIVMLLGGLWHGAAWTFLIWGAIHGSLLGAGRIFHRFTGIDADRSSQSTPARLLRVALTFHVAAACFVLFRSVDLTAAIAFFRQLGSVAPAAASVTPLAWAALLTAACLEWTPRAWVAKLGDTFLRMPSPMQACVITGCLLLFVVIGGSTTPFIYFQF